MRISFFVPKCTPDNSHGRYVIELAKRIGREHPVTVYASHFWPPIRSAVRCRFLPVPNRPAIARIATLWTASIVTKERRHADIVHVQGGDAPVGNVVTAHFCNKAMLASSDQRLGLYHCLNHIIGAAAEKYCMSKSSTRRIIAVSEQVKGQIELEYGVDPNRTVVIHHGVDSQAFHPHHRTRWRVSVRERLGLRRDAFVVIFVGGDYRRKGLVRLLEAVGRVPGTVKVLAVGVKANEDLRRLVRHDLVAFLGHSTEMAPLYAAADCFALPTRYDTFSLATLEAMACGLAELLSPDRDALVLQDAGDVEGLARNLRRLVQDETLRADLGMEARRTAERHSWDKVAERTLAVYDQVLHERR
jgi:glycosyltransferase involved in cell wall biosynthesis